MRNFKRYFGATAQWNFLSNIWQCKKSSRSNLYDFYRLKCTSFPWWINRNWSYKVFYFQKYCSANILNSIIFQFKNKNKFIRSKEKLYTKYRFFCFKNYWDPENCAKFTVLHPLRNTGFYLWTDVHISSHIQRSIIEILHNYIKLMTPLFFERAYKFISLVFFYNILMID